MLYGWMKSVIFYLLLAGLALHMAPTNEYRRYIRYFIGLVVLVLLASPISYLFHLGSGDLQELLAQMESEEISINGGTQAGGSMYDYYDISLRASMKQALAVYGVADVSLVTDEAGNVLSCTVYMSGQSGDSETDVQTGQPDTDETIKNYISDVYNVEVSRIYVVRR